MQTRTFYGDLVKLVTWFISKFKKKHKPFVSKYDQLFYSDVNNATLGGSDVSIKLNGELATTIQCISWEKKDKDTFELEMCEIMLDREIDRRHITKIEVIYSHPKGTEFSKTFTVKYVGERSGIAVDDLVLEKFTKFTVTRTLHVFTEAENEGIENKSKVQKV